mgnify:CR=1 FL=1
MNNLIKNPKWRKVLRGICILFLLASFAAMITPSFNDYEETFLLNIPFFGIAINLNLFNLQTIFMVLGWIFLALGIDREKLPDPEIVQLNLNVDRSSKP